MLHAIGVSSVEELFTDIPETFRFPELDLPEGVSEYEATRELDRLARQNAPASIGLEQMFLGAGAYPHYVPAVVDHLSSRGEFATSYTPYQAEAAQGTLQSIFEYQSMLARLMGVDVVNASHYDGAAAAAEAALMAVRVTRRSRVVVADTLHPQYRAVVATYLDPIDVTMETAATAAVHAAAGGRLDALEPLAAACSEDTACVIVQNPDFLGRIRDLRRLAEKVHAAGALLVVSTNPIALGLFPSPGDHGADIVIGEGQPLGIPLSYGGPYLGLFGCKQELLRRMPGRLVGETVDTDGNRGFVLTLSTREQHIRRGRATSNICTNQGLMALRAAIYLAAMGPQGLADTARLCYDNAHYAASRIDGIDGYSVHAAEPFFNEFVVRCPRPGAEVVDAVAARGALAGYDLAQAYPGRENDLLVCCTEVHTKDDIDRLVTMLEEVGP